MYEYDFVSVSGIDYDRVKMIMNNRGSMGWRVISSVPLLIAGKFTLYITFERKISE